VQPPRVVLLMLTLNGWTMRVRLHRLPANCDCSKQRDHRALRDAAFSQLDSPLAGRLLRIDF
jgi:hypothetical protein